MSSSRTQNFDIPPASDSTSTIGSLTDRFEGLRQALQHNRDERRESSQERRHSQRLPLPTPVHLARTRLRRPAQPTLYSELPVLRGSRSPSASSTAGITPRRPAQRARHSWRRFRREMQDETSNLEGLVRERQIHLRQLHSQLNDTESRLLASDRSNPRQSKRRKINHDDSDLNTPPFKYGYYGQTVAGRLSMQILSCDGGEYPARDPIAIHRENYRAENVLRDDKSVYCTRSSRCNLMLRHRDESVFHLDSLIIRAPEMGYTAPSLQQGLVFVGMTSESLVKGSSSYHIHYDASTHTRSSSPSEASDGIPLAEALNDGQIWEASRNRNPGLDLAPPYTLPLPRPSASALRSAWGRPNVANLRYILDSEDDIPETSQSNTYLDNCDWPALESVATSGLTRAPTPPPFTVTAENEDDGDDDSIRTSDLPDLISIEDSAEEYRNMMLERHGIPRPARRTSPGRIEPRGSFTSGVADGEDEVLQPHATFFMGEHRSKITIKFDPPVSGRFLLLKLFSPQLHHGENIDIQYIQVNGFAGPRFFPKIEMK